MTTPMNARTALRQSIVMCVTSVIAGAVAAGVVLPFAALGIAWGTVIVLTVLVLPLVGLMVRNYHQLVLFAMRRGAGTAGLRDDAALRAVFEEFAAERRAASGGSRRAIDTWPLQLSAWLAGSRHLGIGRHAVRSAGR